MYLQDYLKRERISQKKFAEALDIHRTHLSNILHGRKMPSLRLITKIEEVTNGQVTVQDFFEYYKEKMAKKK